MFRSEPTSYGLTLSQIRGLLTKMFIADQRTAHNLTGPLQELCSELPSDVYDRTCMEAIEIAEMLTDGVDFISRNHWTIWGVTPNEPGVLGV